jgi:hypothetical protein
MVDEGGLIGLSVFPMLPERQYTILIILQMLSVVDLM